MSLEIIRNDITKVYADAIVNTANPMVAVGYGVDSAIYEAAGKEALLAERKKIGVLHPGEVAETPAFLLHARYILHTVGPVWEGGSSGEVETVARCYRNALEKARALGCESIAFPLLASGTYGFPKDVALKTAIAEISGFLLNNEMTVYLVVYDKKSFEISGKVFHDVTEYISENEIREQKAYPASSQARRRREAASAFFNQADAGTISEKAAYYASPGAMALSAALPEEDIDDIIRHREDTFQEYLFRLIDRKGLEDKEVYKKANIDRKHFSKIRSNANYNPSKRTALALAVALGLNLDETRDLLLKAGIALSRSNTFDIIMEYCIEHRITDIYEINCILFKYDQPMLGA